MSHESMQVRLERYREDLPRGVYSRELPVFPRAPPSLVSVTLEGPIDVRARQLKRANNKIKLKGRRDHMIRLIERIDEGEDTYVIKRLQANPKLPHFRRIWDAIDRGVPLREAIGQERDRINALLERGGRRDEE